METIQQREFIEALAARLAITFSEAERYLNAHKQLIYELVAEGKKVNLQGFGQFSYSHREARAGVNPRTGERIMVPELNTPKFKSGEQFKEAVRLRKE